MVLQLTEQFSLFILSTLANKSICFVGVFINSGIAIDEEDSTTSPPFSDRLYFMASVLDPTFGFKWIENDLEEFEVGDIKKQVKSWILEEARSKYAEPDSMLKQTC